MKIVDTSEMKRLEQLSYSQGAEEENFMECAGEGIAECARQSIARFHLRPEITLLCGSGNNGGDAYVSGRLLQEGGFHVRAIALASYEDSTPLCRLNGKRFLESGGSMIYAKTPEDISFGRSSMIIDGILGTGFHGKVKGLFQVAIEKANRSGLHILAVDIPSGLIGNTGEVGGVAMRADETLFLGLPKRGCFLGEAWNYVGQVHVFNFGLKEDVLEAAQADFIMIDEEMIREFLPPIVRTRHKYQAGYVVGLGGSPGMPGAPVMASFAALRAGAGIVRLCHPIAMTGEFVAAPRELIRQGYEDNDFGSILEAAKNASAFFMGPGMEKSDAALKMIKKIIPELKCPCVIDAQALTLLAADSIPFAPFTILTPHRGEMKRLLHLDEEIGLESLLEKTHRYAQEKKVIVVLKGAPTFIFHPAMKPHICVRGDPGMATAGSGDVLTGVIASFLAQVHDPMKAAILGVQFHGIAGEYASQEMTSYSMVAEDITAKLPEVFKKYTVQKKN